MGEAMEMIRVFIELRMAVYRGVLYPAQDYG
jgi:hypothetical protein